MMLARAHFPHHYSGTDSRPELEVALGNQRQVFDKCFHDPFTVLSHDFLLGPFRLEFPF